MYSEPALSSASKEIKATEVASTENGGTRFSLNIDGNAYVLAQKTRSLLVLGDMGELGAGADRIHREVGEGSV